MKKILALAAVAALAGGASVYAANPFSDVSTSDWAYQAVSDLSDQGIVEGYPDGTFKGETNITRYELAQIVARLLAKEDQLSAQQRATVDKLAVEYADELDTLGVRVSNLEKKVGNIAWSGDARLRYQDNGTTDKYTARIRINARATINDSTYAHLRLTTGNVDLKGGNDAEIVADRLYVHHDFGDTVGLTLGKYGVDVGSQNSWLASQTFDGGEAQFALGPVDLKAGYGRFNPEGEYDKVTGLPAPKYNETELGYVQAAADLGAVQVRADYFKGNDSQDIEVIGGGVTVPVGDFSVFGDYYENTAATVGTPSTWTAGLGYKAPKWDLSVAYFDVQDGGVLGEAAKDLTGWQVSGNYLYTNGNFFYVSGNVAVAKNVTLHGEYAFASDVDSGADLDDSYTLSLNYKF